MNFNHTVLLYIATLLIFLTIDSIWLTKVAAKVYKKDIGHLLASKPNLMPALFFYLIYVFGIVFLVLKPALGLDSLEHLIKYAALLGAVSYSTFDLTNQSVLKKWPTKISVIDILWGMVLTTLTSVITFYVCKRIIL